MAEIECRDLVKRYGRKTALDGINLSLEKQRIIGLAGPNGSGKTTLIKLIQRLLTPTSGSIEIERDEEPHFLSAGQRFSSGLDEGGRPPAFLRDIL